MMSLTPSQELLETIELSERDYMLDRMLAIQSRTGNPEGVAIQKFGQAYAFYSKMMPWPSFNTVMGLRSTSADYLEGILAYYKEKQRNVQLEIVPTLVDQPFLNRLADAGLYVSGFHTSLYMSPRFFAEEHVKDIEIKELEKDQFSQYAAIHCKSFGMADNGIPHIAANNAVLYDRPGWKFYLASVSGEPAAAAVMFIKGSVASLTFAATLPQFRGMGLHRKLLQKRINTAFENNCEIIVGQCALGSQSHRNMEHTGMKIGYLRAKWTEKMDR
ncbi:GNAT family N-acetyltransferase [Paenibacillus sp. IITD108]|uniref:GNAT family N-acetyltransferase n=1 Tax=Paenibacillus sp. IITD108 TaxID=3116649 RepID=UPI002F3ED726